VLARELPRRSGVVAGEYVGSRLTMLGCGVVARVSERLFTMLNKTGDEQINYREFIVGVSPMITGDGEFYASRVGREPPVMQIQQLVVTQSGRVRRPMVDGSLSDATRHRGLGVGWTFASCCRVLEQVNEVKQSCSQGR
jgi:hypothetical protein